MEMHSQNFVIHDSEGKILRTGNCPPEHVQLQLNSEGEYLLLTDIPVDPLASIDMKDMSILEAPTTPEKPTSISSKEEGYRGARASSYPSITNQLDMLWHAMNAGEIPKANLWFKTIQAVKESNPKDGSGRPSIVYSVEPIKS